MTVATWRRGAAAIAGSIATLMLLAACSSDGPSEENAEATTQPSPTQETPTQEADTQEVAGCEMYVKYQDTQGASVSIFTSIVAPQQSLFEQSWKEFETCTGIDIVYEGSDQFEAQLFARIAVGNPPDIAFIPRPSLLAELVAGGGPVPASQDTVFNADTYWNPEWKSYGTVNGTFYAAPLGSHMNSFVWYSPKTFAANGYAIPTTWDELWALSDQMVADGLVKPWCGGLEAGSQTGWPSTDWLEEIMLRMFGGEVYDQWVSHELDFDSPQVTAAMDVLAGWMKNANYVNGGFGDVQTIATTPFQEAGRSILNGECGMLQQSNLYASTWGELQVGATIGPDGDVYAFYIPVINNMVAPQPVVGDGEFVTAFSDRPAVAAVQSYLSSAEFATSKVSLGTWVSANNGVLLDTYAEGSIDKLAAQYLTDMGGTFRFDASELMPAVVGAGAMLTEMTQWFALGTPTAEVLQAIDAAWPVP
ncbi:MAG: carbohydrate ABC transporter substrate-binding protein [Actinobacteria bacterium]|nr:carbohydrate ABC transporter substrate-binding protein [Actinomycetota bacterium]